MIIECGRLKDEAVAAPADRIYIEFTLFHGEAHRGGAGAGLGGGSHDQGVAPDWDQVAVMPVFSDVGDFSAINR